MSIRGDAARREREESFTVFFVQSLAPLRRHIESALVEEEHASEDVDELLNDVFLLAWQKWDRPHGITLRWLEVVADNKIRDRRRRQRVRSRAMDAVEQALIPSSSVWDEWDRLAVRRALDALKDREKQALALSYAAGWSARAPSAVGAMLSRARGKIRRTLDGSGADAVP